MRDRARRSAGAVIGGGLTGAVDRLVSAEPAVLAGHDPEAVHEARVATRRLRSDLRTFRRFLDRERTDRVRVELRWLGEHLGAVRDVEVLRERLRADASTLAPDVALGLHEVFARLEREWVDARTDLLVALHSARYERLLGALVSWRDVPPVRPGRSDRSARRALPRLVDEPWRDLDASVRDLADDPTDDDLHRVRILAKRARYAAEGVAPVAGDPTARLARRLRDVQDVLGEHQDAVVAQRWLAKVGGDLPPRRAFAAGVLAGVEHRAAAVARDAFPAAWRRARRARRRAEP